MWRFFKDFMVYGVASIFGKLATIFLMPMYTNILTKEEYGAMALITSCKGIIDLLSNLNIHSGIARDYYEDGIDRKRLISTGFLSILTLSFVIMLIGLLTRHFWYSQILGLKDVFGPAFTVMLLTIPAGSLMSYFAILTRYKKKTTHYSIGTIFQMLIQIGISVIGVVILRVGIISVFYGVLIGELFSIVYFAILNREHLGGHYDKKLLYRALGFALPTLPAILAGWLDSSMGQILIGKYISVEDLGVYSIALSLTSVFTLISTSFHNVWSPFLYENYSKIGFHSMMRKLFVVMSLILVIVSFSLSLFSHEIVLLLSNESYLDACGYIALLCVPMSFYLLMPFASSGIQIIRDTKYLGYSYVAGSCGNLLFLFVTIRYFGVLTVPLCLALSRIITYSFLYKVSERKMGYKLPNSFLTLLIIVAVICYIVLRIELTLLTRSFLAVFFIGVIIYYLYAHYDVKGVLITLKHPINHKKC